MVGRSPSTLLRGATRLTLRRIIGHSAERRGWAAVSGDGILDDGADRQLCGVTRVRMGRLSGGREWSQVPQSMTAVTSTSTRHHGS